MQMIHFVFFVCARKVTCDTWVFLEVAWDRFSFMPIRNRHLFKLTIKTSNECFHDVFASCQDSHLSLHLAYEMTFAEVGK